MGLGVYEKKEMSSTYGILSTLTEECFVVLVSSLSASYREGTMEKECFISNGAHLMFSILQEQNPVMIYIAAVCRHAHKLCDEIVYSDSQVIAYIDSRVLEGESW